MLLVFITAGRAHARDAPVSLLSALNRLARETHIEILFDERLLQGRSSSPDVRGQDPERRLRAILARTGLQFRRSATGAFLVVAAPASQSSEKVMPAPPIADILVVGRRTLNADIPRDQDDIQPYQVFDADAVARSQPSTLGSFLRTELLQNRTLRSLDQTPQSSEASVRSQVDTNGLGAGQTLVLIDGRRVPRITSGGTFLQPDLVSMPVYAIDRIESLGTTAGGIFGIGAAGGAVNIVSRSDFDDVSVSSRLGISQRGDDAQRGVSAHIGLTSRSGATRFSIRVSKASADGLTFGDRNYVEGAVQQKQSRNPSILPIPVSGSINITGAGQTLVLLPSLGGTVLNGSTTFLPIDAPPLATGGAAVLASNAGRLDLSLSPDGQGSLQTFLTPTRTASTIVDLRQDIGRNVTIFTDYLRLESSGVATSPALITSSTFLAPGQSGNPFNQAILISFPTVGLAGIIRNRTLTDRLTVGGIVRLGNGWASSLDLSAGHAASRVSTSRTPGQPASINVFSGPAVLAAELATLPIQASTGRSASRLHDLNLKVAGSPLTLPAGRMFLTFTGELREERSPGQTQYTSESNFLPTTSVGGQRERVSSAFLELRMPLIPATSPIPIFRGLELQLALRHDRYALTAPVQSIDILDAGLFGKAVTARGDVTAVTTGVRVRPFRGLTLRASFASGFTPPTASQITPAGANTFTYFLIDPKRGGVQPSSQDRTFELSGGSPTLRPQLAQTFSAGAIIEPVFASGFRLSVDYTRLTTSSEVADYAELDTQYFINHEENYPSRVQRAPLTADDIAKGYTGGRIVLVDSSYLTVGRSSVDVLDIVADVKRLTPFGEFRLHSKLSWEPSLRRRGVPSLPAYNSVGYLNGPIAVRANAGVDWTKGPISAGLNAQAYGSYRVTNAYQAGSVFDAAVQNAQNVKDQGALRIPAQAYLDGYVGWRMGESSRAGGQAQVSVRLGVKNILDARPPTVVPLNGQTYPSLGYSFYGDPVGRRFVLDVTTSF